MKQWIAGLLLVFSFVTVFADTVGKGDSTVKSYKDYVKIRYMPSRAAFLKNEPITEFKSEAHTIMVKKTGKVMNTNESIRQLHKKAKQLADEGITSNQRYFHVSFTKIEIAYMGDTVSLDYTGKSGDNKYARYEQQWLQLHEEVYQYLNKDKVSRQ